MVKFLVLSLCITLSFLTAQSLQDVDKNQVKNVPGEILIKYNTYNKSKVPGKEILNEYVRFFEKMKFLTNGNINVVKPVCSYLVNKMVAENLTEQAILENSFNKRKAKFERLTGYKGLNKTSLQNFNISNSNASRILLLRLTDKSKLEETIELLKNYSDNEFIIEFAELNYLYTNSLVPNDPKYSEQWSHINSQAEKGWDITIGIHDILIGIIDSGIDLFHEDLQNNISNIRYDFVDIDTNAYKSPYSSLLVGEDYVVPDSIPMDFGGHGTHVAGIIAAEGNNGKGVMGVAPGCTIVPLRAGFSINEPLNGGEQGYLENDDIINALRFAIINGVDIINMSFGSESESGITTNEINSAASAGIILIAAAGNSQTDRKSYPAATNNVISVAATDITDKRAQFSNYGTWVDVAAPGVFIISTIPKSGGVSTSPTGYQYLSGTSMAAPYVSGLAGLILSKNPGLNSGKIKNIIRQNVDPIAENVRYTGTGRVNIFKALSVNSLTNTAAEIISPATNSLITSTIEIKGSFTGTRYSLYYGRGIYPSEWVLISEGTSINGEHLGTFNTTELTDSNYTIKLIASDVYGTSESKVFVRVNNVFYSSTPVNGFPVTLANVEIHYTADSKPVIYDINNDGENEIIVITEGWLHVFNSEGQDIHGWPIYTGSPVSWITPTIADLDNDGFYEILAVSSQTTQITNSTNYLNIYDCEGNKFHGWNSPLFFSSWLKGPVTVDVDGDNYLNVLLFDYSGMIYLYDNEGKLIWKNKYYNEDAYIFNVVVADLNKDGVNEFIACSYNRWIYIIDINGNLLKSFDTHGAWGNIIIADLNKDSNYEIIVPIRQNMVPNSSGVGVWDQNGNLIFKTSLMEGTNNIAVGDINNDSFPEIVFCNIYSPYKLYVLDHNGNDLQGWPRELPNTYSASNIVIDNIDNDESQEIIIGLRNGDIIAYNDDGSKYTMVATNSFVSSISTGDINSDQIPELVCHSYDGRLYAWKLSNTPMERGMGKWAFYNHDIHQSGNYQYAPPRKNNYAPILSMSSSYNINEDDSLIITKFVKDADRDALSFSATSDTSVFDVEISQEKIIIKPYPNWNGSANFKLVAADSSLSDTSSFSLNVNPVNDMPTISSVADTVVYNSDSLFVKLKFSDVDNEKLTLTVSSSQDSVKLTTMDSILIIKPAPGWAGKSKIIVNVSDKFLTASTSFNYTREKLVPVELISFVGQMNNNFIELTWSTATETNNLGFEVERKSGKEGWKKIGFIKGKGTTAELSNYSYTDKSLSTGKFTYRLKQIDFDGTYSYSKEIEIAMSFIPDEYKLSQNYPNPFNPNTIINYQLPVQCHVYLVIYDVLGKVISILVDEEKPAGFYELEFNKANLSSGIYFYVIKAGNFTDIKKFILMK